MRKGFRLGLKGPLRLRKSRVDRNGSSYLDGHQNGGAMMHGATVFSSYAVGRLRVGRDAEMFRSSHINNKYVTSSSLGLL